MEANLSGTLISDLRTLFDEVALLCTDVDPLLSGDLAEVRDELSDEELHHLLTEVLVHIRGGGQPTDAQKTTLAAQVRGLIRDAIRTRRQPRPTPSLAAVEEEAGPAHSGATDPSARRHLELYGAAGMEVRPVRPMPTFLGSDVPLTEGFADTLEIAFWEDNLRLKLDLDDFRRREGRAPEPDELRQMLWPKGALPKEDIYKILPLADDIAARGVQTPPVIDYWGTAWDGNRRLAACRYILASDEYTPEQKARARRIRVWQTDEHATEDQIQAIVTSLNFGDDFKVPWPEYVRARQVYDTYIARRDSEASLRVLTERDETKIRAAVGRFFGIKTQEVTRYCKMVVWALDFEDYHREQDRDESQIANRTNALFQYFYELDSGRGDDKLAVKLRDDEGFRDIVFDLMFDGKFKNWAQIRDLRRVYDNPEALDELKQAHRETDSTIGRAAVNRAIDIARQQSTALRQAGRADELARITKWLNEDVTLAVLRKLDPEVLREFRDAARAVDGMISSLVEGSAAPQAAPGAA
ncbi:hypothetical protein [Geodermatophilus marinus]|uniref:hypothetical protein n=1 Tax=Geodermatophilus sp. LHW52908 TaxID=2303986 RepID=UPI000E3D0885|nr:hypothetical protein [Geodermatophilus sp. LHW52908]RFU21038.1 hypothetical protein D0Z06_13230 [Geodermatophilus sp. LHW52908]